MNFTINVEMSRFSIVEREKIERTLKGKSTIDLLNDYVVFDIETTGLDSSYIYCTHCPCTIVWHAQILGQWL